MDLTHVFVQNLKKWRKNAGFSQKTLAQRCSAAHSYIRQIESGTGHPSFAFIEKLANALDIEPYQLFYDETADPDSSKYMRALKAEFLKKVESEFDTVLTKLKR